MPEPQRPLKGTGIAYEGRPVTTDKFDTVPTALPHPAEVTVSSAFRDYVPAEDIDYTDLSAINKELSMLRIRLNRVRIELRDAERQTAKLKYQYEAEKKRVLIALSGGSASEREAIAELMCEESYTKYLVAATVAKEIAQHNRDLRIELDTLREISNNLRRQIDLQ